MEKTRKAVAAFLLLALFFIYYVPVAGAAEEGTLKLSGFVDAAYADVDDSEGTFSLDQVEVDIEMILNSKLSLRADLNYLDTGTGSALTFEDIIEQGYVTYHLPRGTGVDFTFGKFNAPIGFELLDPVDMYQYSHALVFNFGLPTNLTGLMGAYKISDQIDLSLYIVNGWDNNLDNNTSKTVGGRVGFTPVKGVALGLSAITGITETDTENRKSVVDIDVTVTTIEKLTIGAELNAGKEEGASAIVAGDDGSWNALLLMGHYDFNDIYGLTVRYDYFNDKDGARLGSSMKEKRHAIAIAPTFSLGNGAGLLAEYRHDNSDQNVFDGNTSESTDSIAVEVTYAF